MAKYTPSSISSGYQSTTQLNNNFTNIASELNNKVLYRNNPSGEPNPMQNDLDMNGNQILNVPTPTAPTDVVRLQDLSTTGVVNITGIATSNTIQNLRDRSLTGVVPNDIVYLKYHTTVGDGGAGNFRYISGAAPGTYVDNNGTIVVPTGGNGSAAWLREFSGAVNIKWFGADGGGLVDVTPMLLKAVAVGDKIFFPSGTYLFDSFAGIIGNDLTFFGENKNTTIFKAGVNLGFQLLYLGTNCVVRDIKIDGNASNVVSTSPILTTQTGCLIENIILFNFNAMGIDASAGYCTIQDNKITGVGNSTQSTYGIYGLGANAKDIKAFRNRVYNCALNAIWISSGYICDNYITGNAINNGGGQIAGGTGDSDTNVVVISNNIIEIGGSAVASGIEATARAIISGNRVRNQQNYGIVVYDAAAAVTGGHTQVIGNYVTGSGSDGILIDFNTSSKGHVQIVGNESHANTGHGILVYGNNTNNIICVANDLYSNTAGNFSKGTGVNNWELNTTNNISSWTPTLTFATPGNLNVAYASRSGTYIRIGNVVHLRFSIITSTFTHTTASGSLQITGLPFPNVGQTVCELEWGGITKAGYTDVCAQLNDAASTLSPVASGSGVAPSFVTPADTPTGGTITLIGNMTYFI